MERETKAGGIKLLVVSGVEYCKVNPFRNYAFNLGLNSLSDYFMHTYMIMIQYENTDIFVMIQYDSIQPNTEKLQAKIFFDSCIDFWLKVKQNSIQIGGLCIDLAKSLN